MDATTFFIQCLNSVQYGLLLFLVASGLTLIFGIMGVINLAHGSFYMIGAYMAYALAPLVEREHLQQVLMTYALILVFEELRSILLGDEVHGVPVPGWLAGSLPLSDL